MDLNNYHNKKYLFILRHGEKPDRHFILFDTEYDGQWMLDIANRTGKKYSVLQPEGEDWSFPKMPLEKVLQAESDEGFVRFIQNDIALYEKDDKKDFGDWGWYILKEIDIEKWKALYQTKLSEQRKQLQQVVQKEKKTAQIKMF